MKSRLIAAWVLATAVSVALAYQAVGLVQNQVTEQAPALAAVEETSTTLTADDLPSVPSTVTVPNDAEDRVDAPPAGQSDDLVPGASTSTTTVPPPTTSTTKPSTAPTTSTASTSSTAPATDFIIPSDGGTVTVTCSHDSISLKSALANPGFQTDVRSDGPDEVQIKFKEIDDDLTFEVKATCRDGEVRATVHRDD